MIEKRAEVLDGILQKKAIMSTVYYFIFCFV